MAIAFDAASNGVQGTNTNFSWAHTCSGKDRILIVFGHQTNLATINYVRYNGVNMTRLGLFNYIDLWYLVNPDIGSYNITINISASNYMRFCSSSYTGVDQINPLDGYSGVYLGGTRSSLTGTLVTTKDNDWLVYGCAGSGTIVAGANTIKRANPGGDGQEALGDTNSAQTPPGSHSCVFSGNSNTYWYGYIMALRAALPPAGSNPMFFGGGLALG